MVRRTSLVALLVLVLTAGVFAAEAQKDVLATLKDSGKYASFLGLVEKAGLTDSLKAAGPITVFAVNDEVLGKMPKERLDRMTGNMDRFKVTLQRHIVSGKLMAADISKMKEMKFEGETVLPVAVTEGKIAIGSTNVTKSDAIASNGVIHDVDGFLSRFGGMRGEGREVPEGTPETVAPKAANPAEEATAKEAVKAAKEEEKAQEAADQKATRAEDKAAEKK